MHIRLVHFLAGLGYIRERLKDAIVEILDNFRPILRVSLNA